MIQPTLPDVSEAQQAVLYAKLSEYNRGRASFKEAGVYLVVLPRPGHLTYSLWLYTPLPERQTIFYLQELSADVHEALRTASTLLYYSRRCLILVSYNEKRMRSNGDDLVFFGKYRGHFLHEVLHIDPAYLGWIAYKFVPKIPKQERFVKIAQAYYSVHIDIQTRQTKEKRAASCFLGQTGERLTNLVLRVVRVRLEDDVYKTRLQGNTPQFFVRQTVKLVDASGNWVVIRFPARYASATSGMLSGREHAYRPGELVYIASARIARCYESYGTKYTRLSHVKLASLHGHHTSL